MILRKTKYQVLEITADPNGCKIDCQDIDFGHTDTLTRNQTIRLVKYLAKAVMGVEVQEEGGG